MNRTLLIVADNREDADEIQRELGTSDTDSFIVHWARNLSNSLELLKTDGADVILLIIPPSSDSLSAVAELLVAVPHIPVLVSSDSPDESIADEVLKLGAWDYLGKPAPGSGVLTRALRYAVERRAVEEALFVEQERNAILLHSGNTAALMADISGKVTYLNAAAEQMTGWSLEAASGQQLEQIFKIIDRVTRKKCRNSLKLAMQQDESVELGANCLLLQRNGAEFAIEYAVAPLHDRSGQVMAGLVLFHDVRARALKRPRLAQHDFLTGLPNRMVLNDRLSQAVTRAQRESSQFAVLYLDLDRFKHINDSLGHAIGDQLLQSVADRLVACVRSVDTVSRHGGDEFIVLLADIENPMDVVSITENILNSLAAPHYTPAHDLRIGASVGISVYPNDGADAETLLRHADIAMLHAKQHGRNQYQFFRQEMNLRAQQRQSIEADMRRALRRHEFELHYQPKIDLETGLITGAEALLRWRHPNKGMILPEVFVSIAEDSGLIEEIGQWVLGEACTQAQAWRDAGLHIKQMAVNVSAAEFRRKSFFEKFCATLRETGFDPHSLQLELTETVLMNDVDAAIEIFHQLKALGVQLAIDDFGTGYSSLSYLSRFPIDTLKIDQSFVRDITPGSDHATIVSAVIGMGKSLNQRVVAEGVETPEQLVFLQQLHCDEGQGFHFSAALGASEFANLLRDEKYSQNQRDNHPDNE